MARSFRERNGLISCRQEAVLGTRASCQERLCEGRGDAAMKHSTDGILTTHTGSLPRPDDLVGMLEGHDQREARADPGFQARVADAVKEIVQKQVDAGVTVVNDGEMSKVGYSTYLTDRVTGFSEQSRQPRLQVEASGQFKEYYEVHPTGGSAARRPV